MPDTHSKGENQAPNAVIGRAVRHLLVLARDADLAGWQATAALGEAGYVIVKRSLLMSGPVPRRIG